MKSLIKKLLRYLGYELLPDHSLPTDVRQIKSIEYLSRMYEKIRNIPGNIVECGVGRGRSFLYLATFASLENRGRTIWGFDSFKGFPEPSREDESSRSPQKGEWAGTDTDDIRRILMRAGLDPSYLEQRVRLVPGFLEESLSQYDNSPIALLHLDLDLYQSYKTALKKLFPLVTKGGTVLLDEYNDPAWPGATKAVEEYLRSRPERIMRDAASGKHYIVKA